jgi:hypothetical protein
MNHAIGLPLETLVNTTKPIVVFSVSRDGFPSFVGLAVTWHSLYCHCVEDLSRWSSIQEALRPLKNSKRVKMLGHV